MTRIALVSALLTLTGCAAATLQVPSSLASSGTRFDLQQLQLFPKSGKPIEQLEAGRWGTGTVTRSAAENFTRGGRAMVREKVAYSVGKKGDEAWQVRCEVSRPEGSGPVPEEAASASVMFCAHTPTRERLASFELRLSLSSEKGHAGLVRMGDAFLTIDALQSTREGKPVEAIAGWVFRSEGDPVAAVQVTNPRGLLLADAGAGWPGDIIAAAALAIVACGEPSIDAMRPWVDPGGSF